MLIFTRIAIAVSLACLFPKAQAQESCPINEADYRRVVVQTRPNEPFKLAPLPDGRVMWAERKGAVRIWIPSANASQDALKLSVYQEADIGLQSIAIAQDFARTGHVYLAYDPLVDNHPEGPGRWLSRFTLTGNVLDPASEKRILHVPIDRNLRQGCCHQGGGMAFDAEGNVYWSIGEIADYRLEYANVNEADPHQNSLRTSGNTNDLRGKVLKIHPEPDGSYTIPPGNLFPKGLAKTRPEIFAMGLRNPFTLNVDKRTGWLWVGEVGLDATVPSADKGSQGFDEINFLPGKPANLGHPFFTGPNAALRDYDYVNKVPKELFNVDALQNTSKFNTGLTDLTAAAGKAQGSLVHWTVRKEYSTAFPGLGEGKTAGMVGPTYRFDAASTSAWKFPAAMDGKVFFWDHEREWIKAMTLTPDGQVSRIEPFMTTVPWRGIVDIQQGADGALYVAEYGHGYYTANPEAKISRIEYLGKPCGSVTSGLPAPKSRDKAMGRLAVISSGGLVLEMPAGRATAEILALDGRILWSGAGLVGRVQVPRAGLGAGDMVLVRFR